LVGDQTGAFRALRCIRFESGTPTLAKNMVKITLDSMEYLIQL
jgi:hypothetical protein